MQRKLEQLNEKGLFKGLESLLRLTVIHTSSGIPLFDMRLKNQAKQCDDMLFSGLIRSLSLVLDEAMDSGFVKEIILERGHMIIKRCRRHNLTFTIAVESYSDDVHRFLDYFSAEFLRRFKLCLKNPTNTTQFTAAADILHSFDEMSRI